MAAGLPDGAPPAASEAARRTLGEVVTAADTLPSALGRSLDEAARTAFVEGFRVVSTVSTGVLLVMALVAVPLLRRLATRP